MKFKIGDKVRNRYNLQIAVVKRVYSYKNSHFASIKYLNSYFASTLASTQDANGEMYDVKDLEKISNYKIFGVQAIINLFSTK